MGGEGADQRTWHLSSVGHGACRSRELYLGDTVIVLPSQMGPQEWQAYQSDEWFPHPQSAMEEGTILARPPQPVSNFSSVPHWLCEFWKRFPYHYNGCSGT